jgi:hypothetical protein
LVEDYLNALDLIMSKINFDLLNVREHSLIWSSQAIVAGFLDFNIDGSLPDLPPNWHRSRNLMVDKEYIKIHEPLFFQIIRKNTSWLFDESAPIFFLHKKHFLNKNIK